MSGDLPMAAASTSIIAARAAKLLLTVAVALLALAPPATASVGVGSNAAAPALRVNAKGNAEVSFTNGGRRMTVLVPLTGAVQPGVKLKGADVSKAATRPALPYLKVLRRGPGGWFYALQTWPTQAGPPELRFSRWLGAPTRLTLTAKRVRLGIALEGKVTYDGKPIPTTSRTPGGPLLREYVYLDQRLGNRWSLLGGVGVSSSGSYRKVVSGGPVGLLYRAIVAGPNVGKVYAPDMIVQVPPP